MEALQPITNNMLHDFVAWIDRGERTTRSYLVNLRQFVEYLRDNDISMPDRADVIRYRESLSARGLKPSTVATYLRSVKQFFSWTSAAGLYPDIARNVHAPKVDNTVHKRDALTAQEVSEVRKVIDERSAERVADAALEKKDQTGRVQRATEQGLRDRAMYLLAVTAGLRTIEISRANVRDLETIRGQSYLWIWGKGRSEPDQKKAIAAEVADALREYLDGRSDHPTGASPLFVSTGNRSGGQRIASTTISKMLKRMLQDAGLDSERLTAHSLRHAAGTAAYLATGDLLATQKYMRHASPVTTEIYLHTDDERMDAETAEKICRYYAL